MTSKELYQLWLEHAGAAFELYEQGIMKYAFKVGSSKILPHCLCIALAIWKLR